MPNRPSTVGGGGPAGGGLTDAELRATPVPVSGTVVTGGLTDTQLRATAVPVSGPLTDAQLRAAAVPVSGTVTASGPLTDTQLRATPVPVSGTITASGPLTDTQLRATPVPVSGTVTATGPLTDTQLRATAVPVSGTVTSNQGTASANDWRTDLRRGQILAFAAIDVASSGDNTIVAADATRKVKVLSYSLVADSAVSARWKSGAGTNLTGAMSLAANGGLADGSGNSPATQWLFETAANQALVLNLSGAVGARGRLSYFLEV